MRLKMTHAILRKLYAPHVVKHTNRSKGDNMSDYMAMKADEQITAALHLKDHIDEMADVIKNIIAVEMLNVKSVSDLSFKVAVAVWNHQDDKKKCNCSKCDPLSPENYYCESCTKNTTSLSKCPKCGGPADNGHDRCLPPNPYFCTKCENL